MTYNPWLDAAQRYPHVHIERDDIAPLHASWVACVDVVLIDASLDRTERRCALAHELAHMDVDDAETQLCWFAARQESAADKLAARRLIAIDDLCRVVRCHPDPREAAEQLDVTLGMLVLRGKHLHPSERAALARVLDRQEAVA